ncbi:MAG: SDR family oxidoreductase [Ancalomicrobiaceae bacterium]|nr:SDR family oxidoreductase [Ancalomicrobiaceae bacterium]
MSQTLLVTGAAGKLGRLVVAELLSKGGNRLIAGSRDPSKLADLAAKGAETARVDFDDEASLDAAFAGVDRLLLISTDAVGEPGLRLRQHEKAVNAAAKAGVKHIVYTSMPKPEPGSAIVFAADHYGTEQAIEASRLAYTILRVSWYQENFLMSLPNVLASGQWFTAAGEGKVSHIARADVAKAAVAALASTATASATYNLTSDEALSTDEIAKLASDVFGKPIQVTHVSDEALKAGLMQHGVPEFMAGFIVCFDTNTRLGGVTPPTGDFAKLTGAKPRSLKTYFETHAADYLK